MSTEAAIGFTWLYSTLSSDLQLTALAPGGVWRGLAPPESQTPFIVMSLQSGLDVTSMNAFRILVECTYLVKVVGPASETTTIMSAADRLDALIGSPPTSGTTSDGAVLASYRESPISIQELVNGELFENAGGLYRLQIEKKTS